MKFIKVKAVKYIGKQDTYDLTMRSKYHNFILDNNIVTSNSHSYSYSYLSAITMYLACYYPLEFYTSGLTIKFEDQDQIRNIIKAVKERGFEISAPNINKSSVDFIIDNNSIVFGLGAIKGVGQSLSKKLISNRPKSGYKGIGHFISRNYSILNSKVLESYTKAGCFSCFGYNKETILQSIPYILDFLSIYKGLEEYSIFDLSKISLDEYIENCIIRRSDIKDNLSYEIESLGLYLTSHPLDGYKINEREVIDPSKFSLYADRDNIVTIGCISRLTIKKTKSKTNMASWDLTHSNGEPIKCLMFPSQYSKNIENKALTEGMLVKVAGIKQLKQFGDKVDENLIVNEITDDLKGCLFEPLVKREKKEFILGKYKFILEK